jgi:muramoyltetrapeptide carboxypeptidase
MRFPPAISPGDRIAVVAPSSPIPRAELWRGLAWLRDRYAITMSEGVLARTGYLAGSDDRRSAEFAHAMLDPAIKAIFCARGGYGLTRIVPKLPWDEFRKSPKWIVGFSDVTALHARCASLGIASVHGPNVTGLGRAGPFDRFRALRSVEHAGAGLSWSLTPIVKGAHTGPLFGGNVALLSAMAAAGSLAVPNGAIVILEDVTERPYRVDRMLTSLMPHLAQAGALVFGDFTECDPGPDGVCIDDVLVEFAHRLGKPASRGAPVGHGPVNQPFIVGANARLESNALVLA